MVVVSCSQQVSLLNQSLCFFPTQITHWYLICNHSESVHVEMQTKLRDRRGFFKGKLNRQLCVNFLHSHHGLLNVSLKSFLLLRKPVFEKISFSSFFSSESRNRTYFLSLGTVQFLWVSLWVFALQSVAL